MTRVDVYDGLDGALAPRCTMDRYTVCIEASGVNRVFAMGEAPTVDPGRCQSPGNEYKGHQVNRAAIGRRLDWAEVPTQVQRAALARLEVVV